MRSLRKLVGLGPCISTDWVPRRSQTPKEANSLPRRGKGCSPVSRTCSCVVGAGSATTPMLPAGGGGCTRLVGRERLVSPGSPTQGLQEPAIPLLGSQGVVLLREDGICADGATRRRGLLRCRRQLLRSSTETQRSSPVPTSYSLRSVAPANHQVANPEPEPPRVQRSSSAAQGPAWVVHRATSWQREGRHPSQTTRP